MQNDLISRSALLKEFENRQEQQTNKYCDCFLNDAQELSTEWWCVEDAVIAAPTIDAVEVVRCRECKYMRPLEHDGFVACIMWCRAMHSNGFCYEGRKKDAKDIDDPIEDGGATDAAD